MNITFNEIVLKNFKSHKDLTVVLHPLNRILGTNGAGKSSIGEAVTWALYGVDTMGNTLIKALSPEPTNYEFDRVEVHLLMTVDMKQIRISRMIEKGKAVFYINDDPKTATAFKEIIESLFDKNMFLSLFNPIYFFTQKQEEQRAQLLQYVPHPTSAEVLEKLKKLHSDTLGPLLKKKALPDLEAHHKDNKNRKDKELIAAKERVKTLKEQAGTKELSNQEYMDLRLALENANESIKAAEAQEAEARAVNEKAYKLNMVLEGIKREANELAGKYKALKGEPIGETCDKCGQKLDEHTVDAVKYSIGQELSAIKSRHSELLAKYDAMKAESKGLVVVEVEPHQTAQLRELREILTNQIREADERGKLSGLIFEAENTVEAIETSFKDSVLILEAIKAFKAAESELMAGKIADLFPTLTLELYQENKGDGERKPFFEVYQDGKPFRKLSQAESVKAGLELVDVLSNQSGIVAPVFIDGAESIITYKAPAGQLIECRVADQPLTIMEVEI
ncbi:ATP-binding protein [Paenibacillus harenae]|uniref:ATP-binding protein n=1 Tax=Paenibacillus harenae TaxID=306543 RepID=UPI0004258DDD|nr:ATP-binding protein [Paenibacillus harenae]